MLLSNNEIGSFVYHSFHKAFSEKDKDQLKGNNPFRSAYFVSLIGKHLERHFTGAVTNYQSVDSILSKKKIGGEWLFDISVTSQMEIADERMGGSSVINTNILFACESEFETSLNAFATDFGKLICSNANQYLFIQGLNQRTSKGRRDFIESRMRMIQRYLGHRIGDDFVLAFVPTPGKVGSQSLWDEYTSEILTWIEIYSYDASENTFVKMALG